MQDSDPVFLHSLEDLRDHINDLDHKLLDLLAERMGIARKIGEYKRENNITILQPERWAEIIASRAVYGTERSLTEKFIEAMYNEVHKESIRHQTKVMNEVAPKNKV
jgi:chorismate mutase